MSVTFLSDFIEDKNIYIFIYKSTYLYIKHLKDLVESVVLQIVREENNYANSLVQLHVFQCIVRSETFE